MSGYRILSYYGFEFDRICVKMRERGAYRQKGCFGDGSQFVNSLDWLLGYC